MNFMTFDEVIRELEQARVGFENEPRDNQPNALVWVIENLMESE